MRIPFVSSSRCACALVVGALALSAIIGSGCGSGGDQEAKPQHPAASDSPGSTVPATQPSGSASPNEKGGGAEIAGSEGKQARHQPVGEPSGSGSSSSQSAPSADKGEAVDKGQAAGSRIAKSNSGRCPPGTSRSECEEIAAHDGGDTPSHVVASPEECVKAIGRERCERLLEAEAASGDGKSFDAKECMRNPTPRCEAALLPILEAEQAGTKAQ